MTPKPHGDWSCNLEEMIFYYSPLCSSSTMSKENQDV